MHLTRFPVAVSVLVVLAAVASVSPTLAQPLYTRDLCGIGANNIGTNMVSIPSQTDMMTAEDLCAAIPLAATVAQGAGGIGGRRWVYDCVTGACTSPTSDPIPEPGCAASACFCLDRGDGVEIRPTASTTWDVNRCDTFESIVLPADRQRFEISVPFDTFLVTMRDLAVHFSVPYMGAISGQGAITHIDCATGAVTSCLAGSVCANTALIPGDAYIIVYPAPTSVSATNPTACTPVPVPPAASCPIGDLGFTSSTTLGWTAPTGCPLPLLYDAIRGDMSCLRGFCTQSITPLAYSCAGCTPLEIDDVDTMAVDAAVPPVGVAWWYQVRVDGGTWNAGGPLQCSDWDFMLSADGCP